MKKAFGCCNLSLPKAERLKWVEQGWLGQDGICKFPEAVQATLMDVRLKGLPPEFWKAANDAQLSAEVSAGHIVFVDGNGVELTKEQWAAKYPGYPDVEYLARLMKKLPPGEKRFIQIGGGVGVKRRMV